MSTAISPTNQSPDLPTSSDNKQSGLAGRLLNGLPTIIVFLLLGSVMFLGHHTGWKLIPAAELFGEQEHEADDWCAEHLVPESECIECDPDLYPKPKEYGFCKIHGVAECVIDHPDLAQVNGEPQLPQYDTAAAIALLPRPENNPLESMHKSRIQFASIESARKFGIDIDIVQTHLMRDEISANAEVVYDPMRVAQLKTKAPGSVVAVYKTVGDPVQQGEIVAIVDAVRVGDAKSAIIQALVQVQFEQAKVDRLKDAGKNGSIARKFLLEAEAAYRKAEVNLIAAKQALANLGFILPENIEEADPKKLAAELLYRDIPTHLVGTLPQRQRTANLIPVLAPFNGIVTSQNVVAGEVVDSTTMMLKVVDPSQMWLVLNVKQEEAQYVHIGLPVRFESDDETAQIDGNISWISPEIDPQTRTIQVRVVLENSEGLLRDRMYGMGHIILREEPNAIVVPKIAVQSTSDAHFVFVRDKNYFNDDAPKVFYVRQVRLGASDGEFVELLAGALPGEVVATQGSSVLLGQLLRSNLGAGCGCHSE